MRTSMVIALCLVVLCGCRKQDSASPGDAAAGAGRPITLIYWRHHYEAEQRAIEQFVKDFEAANPDIRVQFVSIPYSTYINKIVSSIAAETGPDVINIHNSWAYNYIRGENIQPIPPSIATSEQIERDYFPLLASMRSGDKYYGLPIGGSNLALFYNTDMFEEAGLNPNEPPVNWSELATCAVALTKREGTTLVRSGAAIGFPARQGWNHLVEGLFRQNGAAIINDEGSRVLWNCEAGVEALTFYTHFIKRLRVYSYEFLRAEDAFQTGRAAMIVSGSWTIGRLAINAPDLPYKVAVLPEGPEGRATYGTYWGNCVTRKAQGERAEAAWKFVRFITAPQQATRWAEMVGEVPMLRAFANDDEFFRKHPKLEPFIEQMEYSYSSLKKDEAVYKSAIVEAVEKVLLQNVAPQDALDEAAEKVNRMLAEH